MQDRTQDKGRPAVSRTGAVCGRRSGAGAAVRIGLNPHSARRLDRLLGALVIEYEKRFGPLGPETPEGSVH